MCILRSALLLSVVSLILNVDFAAGAAAAQAICIIDAPGAGNGGATIVKANRCAVCAKAKYYYTDGRFMTVTVQPLSTVELNYSEYAGGKLITESACVTGTPLPQNAAPSCIKYVGPANGVTSVYFENTCSKCMQGMFVWPINRVVRIPINAGEDKEVPTMGMSAPIAQTLISESSCIIEGKSTVIGPDGREVSSQGTQPVVGTRRLNPGEIIPMRRGTTQ